MKANVAKQYKQYQPLMAHSLLVHVLIAVYQKAIFMKGTRNDINLNSSWFKPVSSGGT